MEIQPKESEIQKAILDYFAHFKYTKVWRNNSGTAQVKLGKNEYWMKLAPKGTPDLIGYLPDGRFLGIEVKRPGQHATKEQQEFLDELNARGGLGFVAHSIDEVVDTLRNYGYA